jgi:hypothetical protein
MRNRTASPTTKAAPFAQALADLEPHLLTVRERLAAAVQKQLKLEPNGTPPKYAHLEQDSDEQQAAAMTLLLNGHRPPAAKRQTWSEVVRERAVCERALAIGASLHEQLRLKARGELGEAHRSKFDALMQQKAQAVIGLLRIEEDIANAIRGTDLGDTRLLGYLSNTASPAFTFLEPELFDDLHYGLGRQEFRPKGRASPCSCTAQAAGHRGETEAEREKRQRELILIKLRIPPPVSGHKTTKAERARELAEIRARSR